MNTKTIIITYQLRTSNIIITVCVYIYFFKFTKSRKWCFYLNRLEQTTEKKMTGKTSLGGYGQKLFPAKSPCYRKQDQNGYYIDSVS